MTAVALLVRHKSKAGCRSQMMQIWEKHVKHRVVQNSGHLAYYFCFDASDEDKVTAFQVFESEKAKNEFLSGDWYAEYLGEVEKHIAEPPIISAASVIWSKKHGTTI